MPKKSYLIVSRAFYPMNSPRANRSTELAKELCRQGHAVTVLAPAHSDQAGLIKKYGLKIADLGQPSWPEVPLSGPGALGLPQRALRRVGQIFLDYPTSELVFRIPITLQELGQHDVLISVAAPHAVHWGVARSLRKGIRPAKVWLADCGDPFMGQENDSFSAAFYFKYLEKDFCRRADAITVPVEGAREAYYPEFREKIHVIPQGFRFQDYAHLNSIEPANDGVARFAFAGLFIPGRRDPTRFLEYLVRRQKPFEFHVFTKNPALVTPFAKRDARIILRDFLPRENLLQELAHMDFLVNIENMGARQTPSKLIDYWLARRPILNLDSQFRQRQVADEFLAGKYDRALKILRPERYNISSVAQRFDELAEFSLRAKRA